MSGSASETVLSLMGSRRAAAAGDLLVAAEKGDAGAVESLRSRGGHPDGPRGLRGYAALHYAGKGGHHASVALLLRHGASATLRTEVPRRKPPAPRLAPHGGTAHPGTQAGDTALHLSAYGGSDSCCEALLDAGAEVDATNEVRPSVGTALGAAAAHDL